MDPKINISQIEQDITQIQNERQDRKHVTEITFYDLARHYRIIEFTFAAVIGFSLTFLMQDIANDIINPIIKQTFFPSSDFVTVLGITFNIEQILATLIFLVLFVTVIYIIFRFFLGNTIAQIIEENTDNAILDKEADLKDVILQNRILSVLNEIKDLLAKNNK